MIFTRKKPQTHQCFYEPVATKFPLELAVKSRGWGKIGDTREGMIMMLMKLPALNSHSSVKTKKRGKSQNF
jgi:hypothetical protein